MDKLTATITILALIFSIIFNAVGDGLRQRDIKNKNNNNGILYHFAWAIEKLIFIMLIFIDLKFNINNIIVILLSYSLIRFGIFNIIRNVFAGDNFMYIGRTSFSDKWLSQEFNKPFSKWILIVIRFGLFVCGLAILQYNL